MMKAAIALLASHEAQNFVRKIAFDLNRQYGVDFVASLKPAHITLKQAFSFESMERLERYFDMLARSTPPFEIELDKVYHAQWADQGFLGLNVKETGVLRELHNRINRELCELFEDTSPPPRRGRLSLSPDHRTGQGRRGGCVPALLRRDEGQDGEPEIHSQVYRPGLFSG